MNDAENDAGKPRCTGRFKAINDAEYDAEYDAGYDAGNDAPI